MTRDAGAIGGKRAPADADERCRHLFDEVPAGVWLADADGRLLDMNPVALRMLGLTAADATGRRLCDLLAPEDHRRLRARLDHAIAGVPMSDRFAVRHAGGAWLSLDVRHVVTGARRWQAIVREADPEAQRQDEALIGGIPQLVWRAAADGGRIWSSPQWAGVTGQTVEESLASGWIAAIHPEDRSAALAAWRDAAATGELETEERLQHVDGGYRWFKTRATPVRDADGAIVQWLGTSTDIDDIRRRQQRQQELVAELQHRTRNVLMIVRSVFSRTVAAGGSSEEALDHFRGRLDSLARTQVMMTQSPAGGVDLENLVRDELLSVGVQSGPALTIEGPEVGLTPRTAEMVGMAMHELTTNAVKFGALRTPGAMLAIRWAIDDATPVPHLTLEWVERGVPAVQVAPEHSGFGRELIEEALPYRLGATTRLEFRGGGVTCTIVLPLRPDAP